MGLKGDAMSTPRLPFRYRSRLVWAIAAAGLPLPMAAQGPTVSTAPLDEPGAAWAPAAAVNFRTGNRPVEGKIDRIVIHDIEGPAESAVRWFQNPMARVSAHYVVDHVEGRIWQQVRERDIGFHAGSTDMNGRSVGIEHSGYAYRPGFFSPALYEASARLVRGISSRYGIPRDRDHIIAHAEVPHPTDPTKFGGRSGHTDPGPYWDWDYYMALVRNDGRIEAPSVPAVIHPGERLALNVTATNRGDDAWPAPAGARAGRSDSLRELIYLGRVETPSSAPGGSSVYDFPTWVSPVYLSALAPGKDVLPTETGTFSFMLRGPRTLGPVQEKLRLVKVPIAPKRPVPFGEAIDLKLRVEPWTVELDTRAPGFSAPGWTPHQVDGRTVMEHRFSRSGTEVVTPARWQTTLPIDGSWEVQARWPQGKKLAGRVRFDVTSGNTGGRVILDARQAGEWRSLGRFPFVGAKPEVTVTLTADDGQGGVVAADAIRFVGPL